MISDLSRWFKPERARRKYEDVRKEVYRVALDIVADEPLRRTADNRTRRRPVFKPKPYKRRNQVPFHVYRGRFSREARILHNIRYHGIDTSVQLVEMCKCDASKFRSLL